MLFYGKYENGQRYICAYDEEKHGAPRVMSDNWTYLYHKSIIINRVYKTEREAMADSWGKYSDKSVIMPDGTETTPARYFGTEDINDVFISWYDVKGERWPGETAIASPTRRKQKRQVNIAGRAEKSVARRRRRENMEGVKYHEKNYTKSNPRNVRNRYHKL